MSNSEEPSALFGDKELDEHDHSGTWVCVRVWLDDNLFIELKKRAKESGTDYRTLMRHTLRDALFGSAAGKG